MRKRCPTSYSEPYQSVCDLSETIRVLAPNGNRIWSILHGAWPMTQGGPRLRAQDRPHHPNEWNTSALIHPSIDQVIQNQFIWDKNHESVSNHIWLKLITDKLFKKLIFIASSWSARVCRGAWVRFLLLHIEIKFNCFSSFRWIYKWQDFHFMFLKILITYTSFPRISNTDLQDSSARVFPNLSRLFRNCRFLDFQVVELCPKRNCHNWFRFFWFVQVCSVYQNLKRICVGAHAMEMSTRSEKHESDELSGVPKVVFKNY